MKSYLKASVSLAALAVFLVSPAYAADIGMKDTIKSGTDVPYQTPAKSWTGPWIGISGGYGVGTLRPDGGDFGYSAEGLVGKVDGGFDVQFGRFVAGLSACAELVDVDGAEEALCIGGRAGVLVTSDSLLYVPVGYRWQGVDAGGDTEYLSGFYAGLGLETRLTDVISVKLEGQHTFYSKAGDDDVPEYLNVEDTRIMAGVNFRFGGRLPYLGD